MNYLAYPCKTMKLTQSHTDGNHARHNSGSPKDYPIDECCGDTGRGWFYCPCDKMKVVKKYTAGINTVWLESVTPVVMPMGTAYVTVMVEHLNDDDMNRLSVGQVFKRGEKMFREGKDGATGNHFHISVGTGHIKEGGWCKNSAGAWVLQVMGKCICADKAFFVEDTNIVADKSYVFLPMPKAQPAQDNLPDKYAAAAVAWALQNKILVGDDTGNQKLHSPITRQDAIVMLHRALR